jgi:hypothetical protein
VNWTQSRFVFDDLFVTAAVKVTPAFSVKMPLPALLTSSQVALAVIVTV